MMDIVERLREPCSPFGAAEHGSYDVEAADEIERLRARRPVVCGTCWELDDVADDCPDCGQDGAGPGVRWEE